MANELYSRMTRHNLKPFWWVFALRGGLAVVFSGFLYLTGSLLGTLFLDALISVSLCLLLGSYVFGNGVLLGVAASVALEHHMRLWWLLLAESAFTLVLGAYIGLSLVLTAPSLAILAGIHALGTGCFQGVLALKLRYDRWYVLSLSPSALVSIAVGLGFLLHAGGEVKTLSLWLSGFELFFGAVLLAFAFRAHSEGSSTAGGLTSP